MKGGHLELIDSRIAELLDSLAPLFSTPEQSEVREFVDAGEYGLALETLCGIVTEEHKVVAASVKEQVRELRDLMGLDSPMIDALIGAARGDANGSSAGTFLAAHPPA